MKVFLVVQQRRILDGGAIGETAEHIASTYLKATEWLARNVKEIVYSTCCGWQIREELVDIADDDTFVHIVYLDKNGKVIDERKVD